MVAGSLKSVIFIFQTDKQSIKQQEIRRYWELISVDFERFEIDVYIDAWDNSGMEHAVVDIPEQVKERLIFKQLTNWVKYTL